MKLIVGLGNPGQKYEHTRHNVGFIALDHFLRDSHAEVRWENNFDSHIASVTIENERVIFIKPQTYMNESGKAVTAALNFYKVSIAENLLVIHDEVDLPFGTIRENSDSSAAGHNGVKSIIEALSSQNFHRLRIGVETRESREHMPTDAFVLENFTPEERKKLEDDVLPQVDEKIELFLEK
jgi:PTH1 family peptidyl-tRNA hydrolase